MGNAATQVYGMVHHSSFVPFPCVLVLQYTHYLFFSIETLFRSLFYDHWLDFRKLKYHIGDGQKGGPSRTVGEKRVSVGYAAAINSAGMKN